ncbi:hypothetical protein NFI96_024920 [Prochilodus magdalenae]|nr:hypothetical protein NFI96_024920 [Prochilodus magdalenae]
MCSDSLASLRLNTKRGRGQPTGNQHLMDNMSPPAELVTGRAWVTSLDCRQVSSAPGLCYCGAMLLYRVQNVK